MNTIDKGTSFTAQFSITASVVECRHRTNKGSIYGGLVQNE